MARWVLEILASCFPNKGPLSPPGRLLASSSGRAFSVNRVVFLSPLGTITAVPKPPSWPWAPPATGSYRGGSPGNGGHSLATWDKAPRASSRGQKFNGACPMGQVGGQTKLGVHWSQSQGGCGCAEHVSPGAWQSPVTLSTRSLEPGLSPHRRWVSWDGASGARASLQVDLPPHRLEELPLGAQPYRHCDACCTMRTSRVREGLSCAKGPRLQTKCAFIPRRPGKTQHRKGQNAAPGPLPRGLKEDGNSTHPASLSSGRNCEGCRDSFSRG